MSMWTDLTVPFRVERVDVDGVGTRALVAGDGEDVLFLHGTSGHLEAFTRNIVPHVEAGFRCHAIDLLGHGYTDKPDYDYEIPRYVDHVLGYLDVAAASTARTSPASRSAGGSRPGSPASTPTACSRCSSIAAGGTRANPEVMERIRTSTLRAVELDDRAVTRQRLELLMHHVDGNVTDELVDVRHRIYHTPEFRRRHPPPAVPAGHGDPPAQPVASPTGWRELAGTPTLIIWGHENPFGDVPEAHAMHECIPGSRLELYPECGHWPQYEHPELYNPMSIEFLRESR